MAGAFESPLCSELNMLLGEINLVSTIFLFPPTLPLSCVFRCEQTKWGFTVHQLLWGHCPSVCASLVVSIAIHGRGIRHVDLASYYSHIYGDAADTQQVRLHVR